jgi:hypothetical protein
MSIRRDAGRQNPKVPRGRPTPKRLCADDRDSYARRKRRRGTATPALIKRDVPIGDKLRVRPLPNIGSERAVIAQEMIVDRTHGCGRAGVAPLRRDQLDRFAEFQPDLFFQRCNDSHLLGKEKGQEESQAAIVRGDVWGIQNSDAVIDHRLVLRE